MSNTTDTKRGEITWSTQVTHHEINVSFWDNFVNEFGKIARRMEKKGFPAPTFTVAGDDFLQTGTARVMCDDGIRRVKATWMARPITITSHQIKMAGGFTVVGTMRTVSTDENGKPMNVVMKHPDFDGDIDGFRDHGMHCDHCGFNRNRKDVVILNSEEQGFVQVGKTCLKDFLGVDPALLFNNNFRKPEEWIEAHTNGGQGSDFAISLDDMILATVIHREKSPWKPVGQDNVCSISAIHGIHWDLNSIDKPLIPTEAQVAKAAEVKKVMEDRAVQVATNPATANAFTFKVVALVRQGFAVWKHGNILAAGVSKTIDWLNRDSQPAPVTTNDAGPNAGHFGTVGGRSEMKLNFDERFFTSEGKFGTTWILKGTNAEGKRFTWFAKDNKFVQDFVKNGVCTAGTIWVKATVKKHDNHPRFGHSTILSRISPL